MRLAWLLASGHVYLRDVQGSDVRSVWANQIDFDRQIGLIRVLGTPHYEARIYDENLDTGDSKVVVGEEFIINLHTGAVRTGATRGEFREQ